ncbi:MULTISPECIES: MbcA/ParS/Xre antitoxin family protein [Marinomonas]|uniref:MbcA/ParS/Xre antitoxin family protein n=1 Tax=Marinomonas rhodophyticola TaxID=2992803 RepID=A0ABT3KFU7_9GAMM|nr:MbcA/ParS/Xre antitoxin family protein [Marinomonas sp. KJ51-3]MCW4629427.1 MbcA/ParS/Xre antitoxin family protein [Marinomonas sp. KJ51-3]
MKSPVIMKNFSLDTINNVFPNVDIMSPIGYFSIVRSRVSGDQLKAITDFIGEKELIARSIGTTSNLSKRYQTKRLSSAATDNLIDLLRVYIQAAKIYESIDLAKEWMRSSIPALGGEIPVNMIDSHSGREVVRQVLRRMEFGEYM